MSTTLKEEIARYFAEYDASGMTIGELKANTMTAIMNAGNPSIGDDVVVSDNSVQVDDDSMETEEDEDAE